MYMIRPFPGRVNPTGEKELAGFYCWFSHANQPYTRHYGGGRIYFEGVIQKNKAGEFTFTLLRVSRTMPTEFPFVAERLADASYSQPAKFTPSYVNEGPAFPVPSGKIRELAIGPGPVQAPAELLKMLAAEAKSAFNDYVTASFRSEFKFSEPLVGAQAN